jgi:hypothetical protein
MGERISAWRRRKIVSEAARVAHQKAEDLLLTHGVIFRDQRRAAVISDWYGNDPPGPTTFTMDAQASLIAIEELRNKQATRHRQIDMAAANMMRSGKVRSTRSGTMRSVLPDRKPPSEGLGD